MNIKLYIPTCDKYENAMYANILSMQEYWPIEIPVVILGYKTPNYNLPENYTFISLGNDRGAKYWGDDMIKYFSTINDEYILYDNDDTILLTKVNYKDIEELFNVIICDSDIKKINITGDVVCRPHEKYENKKYGKFQNSLIVASQTSEYRLSVQGAIWNREYFLRYLRHEMSPWEFELAGSARAVNDGVKILGTNSLHPVIRGHIYRKGQRILNTDSGREWWKAWNKTGINPETNKKYELDQNSDLYQTIKNII